MKQQPLISVLVPAYNHEKFIRKTLDSILEDDYSNKELIILNDGSTDNTEQEIEAWLKDNKGNIPVIYKYQKNCGISKTRNSLIEKSNGAFLVFISSDDYLLQEGIRKRFNYLTDNPEKLAVFSDCIVVDENDHIISESGLSGYYSANKENLKSDKKRKKELVTNWSVPGGTLMIKRETYNKFQYDESLLIEDLDFYLKLVSQNKLGFIDEKVSAYRVHGANTCMKDENWVKIQKDIINTYKKNLKRFPFSLQLRMIYKMAINYKPLLIYKLKKKVN